MAEKEEEDVAYDEGEVVYEEGEIEEGEVENEDGEDEDEDEDEDEVAAQGRLYAGGHASHKNRQKEPSAFMSRVLSDVTQHASPNMLSVLFENQLEIARGLRCVIRVPRRPTSPTRWGLLCPAMASVDRANEARANQSTDPFSYYDGFDMYTSELEARDTRFSDPLIVRPNPVFDSALVENTFVDRKVFSSNSSSSSKSKRLHASQHASPHASQHASPHENDEVEEAGGEEHAEQEAELAQAELAQEEEEEEYDAE